jgi:hypothetical protein
LTADCADNAAKGSTPRLSLECIHVIRAIRGHGLIA